MARKKLKKVYKEGVKRWEMIRQEYRNGHLNFIVKCPFCFNKMAVDAQAALKTGKKCVKCKAVHWMNGYASRGYVPSVTPDESVRRGIASQADAPLNPELREKLGIPIGDPMEDLEVKLQAHKR